MFVIPQQRNNLLKILKLSCCFEFIFAFCVIMNSNELLRFFDTQKFLTMGIFALGKKKGEILMMCFKISNLSENVICFQKWHKICSQFARILEMCPFISHYIGCKKFDDYGRVKSHLLPKVTLYNFKRPETTLFSLNLSFSQC